MTTQEKANQLVEKFSLIMEVGLANTEEELAKYFEKKAVEFTNIVVDEIITDLKNEKRINWLHDRKGGEEYIVYWEKVKEALSNIDCA